jgi:hypothetical protein
MATSAYVSVQMQEKVYKGPEHPVAKKKSRSPLHKDQKSQKSKEKHRKKCRLEIMGQEGVCR